MIRTRFALSLLGGVMACTAFEPRSTEGACGVACGGTGAVVAGPGVGVVSPSARVEAFATGSAHLFSTSSRAASVVSLALDTSSGVTPRPSFQFSKLEGAAVRPLFTSPDLDLAALLTPKRNDAWVVCPGGQASVRGLSEGANAVLMAASSEQGTTLFVAIDQRAGSRESETLSLFESSNDCNNATLQATLEHDGPYEVQASKRALYVSSPAGMRRMVTALDTRTKMPVFQTLDARRLTRIQVTSVADVDFLTGFDGNDLRIIMVDGEQNASASTLTEADLRAEARPAAHGGGQDPGHDGGASGEGGGGGGSDTTDSGGANGAAGAPNEFDALPDAMLTPGGSLVLVQPEPSVAVRRSLPLDTAGLARVELASRQLTFGAVDDCALGYTPGQRTVERVDWSKAEAQAVTLLRSVSAAKLICRPSRTQVGASSCCEGVALLEHEPEPGAPLGQTEAYSLVELDTLRVETFFSSLGVRASTAFDHDNALLIASGDERSAQFRVDIVTPFVGEGAFARIERALDGLPIAAGEILAPDSVGYVGMSRADGSVLFVMRPTDAPITPLAYSTLPANDFRLQDRVHTEVQ